MKIEELKIKLTELGISTCEYNLTNELVNDAINLYQNYDVWEVFYLDEKGNRNNEKKFESESTACQYIYKLFKDAKAIAQKFQINTKS